MHTIITQPAREAHPDLDASARHRADRLAKATSDQIQAALAYLSMIDPEAFEIAFTAVACTTADDSEDEEPIPLCRTCGASVGIFPEVSAQLASLPRRRHRLQQPPHLRPRPRPGGRLVPPRRGPGRVLEATNPVPRRTYRRGTRL